MILEWNVSPDIVHLGPLQLRWYGLMFIAGFSIGYSLMKTICVWEGKSTAKLNSLLIHIFLGTLIGARLGHCIFYDFEYYFSEPLRILKVWEGGLASHGGGIGVIIALLIFSRRNPEFSLWWLLDRISVFTVMTGAFIRLGNLMNSEILGKPTDGSWGVIFKRVDLIPRHPAMVYESICYALIFVFTYRLYLKKKQNTPPGLLFGLVITLIMSCRFVIEFFKEHQSAFEKDLPLDMGQILSIPFVLVGLVIIWLALKGRFAFDPSPATVSGKGEKKRKKRES